MSHQTAETSSVPLTPEEEAAWRALGRAVLVIPRVLDADLLASQGLSMTELVGEPWRSPG